MEEERLQNLQMHKEEKEMFDEISHSLPGIGESSWISDEDSKKLNALRKRVYGVYTKYKKAVDNG